MNLFEIIKKNYQQKQDIKQIRINFRVLIRELNLVNKMGVYPANIQVKFLEYGYENYFSISRICDYSNLENNINFIKDCFGAYTINLKNDRGLVTLTVYTKELEEKNYTKTLYNGYTLLLGYNYTGNITTNMLVSPHLLVSGLSGQGKTGQLRVIVSNLGGFADIYLLNCFKSDFRGFENLTFINGNDNILEFLENYKKNEFKEHQRPNYIIIDELMMLSEDKKIQKLIKEFLCVCRHYNTFIIGVIQVARSEDFKSKTFFNSRVSFRQVDKSSYSVALGSSGELEELEKREFYCKGSEGLQKGYTYTLTY